MRVSTGMIFNSGVNSIQKNTSSLLHTQQQISSGRRVLTPSDDPLAAASAMEVTQSQGINKQYQLAHENAKSTLGIMDNQLSSATDLLARIRELTVQGGNAALSASDRKSIATELRSRFDELVGLGNSTDGTGQYLFSGYQGGNKPFSGSVENGVAYAGDEGQRTLRVSGSRNLPISDSGNDLFMRIKNGNGVFATNVQSAKSINEHSANISAGTVTNTTLWSNSSNPSNMELRFWVDAAGGGVNTPGQAVASLPLPAGGPTFTDGVNDQLTLTVDGTAYPVDLSAGGVTNYPNTAALIGVLQGAIGAAGTVSLDATGKLVVTSATSGSNSSVSITEGNGAMATLFGSPGITAGLTSAPGQTFYDLVDKATGSSLFTGTPSNAAAGALGGTYARLYTSGATVSLSSAGPVPPSFDFGATVSVTGSPASGDTFAIDRVNGTVVTSPAVITHTNAVIDKGAVTDPIKWTAAGNGQNMEVRFWVDTLGGVATSGQSVGNVAIQPGVTVGAANQFNITLNGAGPTPVNVTPGTYATPAAFATQLQADLDAALGLGQARASLDAANHVVITSATTGATSAVSLSEGNGGLTALFGTPTATAGFTGPAGATYYDLVDASTGKSLYSGTPSATGVAGTYTHPYASVHGTLTGAVDLSGGFTPAAGINDTLNLTIDGVARSVTIPPGPGAGGIYTFPELQAQLQGQLAAYGVSVGASGNDLLITSNSGAGSSAVTMTAPASNGATALLGAAASNTALQFGTNATINLKGTSFDYGASVTISGNPANGDTYTIKGNTDPALGNGYFVTAAKTTAGANMGGGIIGTGEVLDQAKWNSQYNSRQLEVRFWKDPTNTSVTAPVYYDLVDAKTEKSLFTDTTSTSGGGNTTFTHVFKSGDSIAFSGLAAPYNDFGVTATISGTPTSGDRFTLQSSVSQSIFETVGNLINALESPIGPVGSTSNAELQNKLGFALTSIATAGDNISRVRADVGSRLGEVDDLSSVSQNMELQYSSTLSSLQDVDYAKAITDLNRMQMELQAAQQSFAKISNLSLFSYL